VVVAAEWVDRVTVPVDRDRDLDWAAVAWVEVEVLAPAAEGQAREPGLEEVAALEVRVARAAPCGKGVLQVGLGQVQVARDLEVELGQGAAPAADRALTERLAAPDSAEVRVPEGAEPGLAVEGVLGVAGGQAARDQGAPE
jgi:hypothetical protein